MTAPVEGAPPRRRRQDRSRRERGRSANACRPKASRRRRARKPEESAAPSRSGLDARHRRRAKQTGLRSEVADRVSRQAVGLLLVVVERLAAGLAMGFGDRRRFHGFRLGRGPPGLSPPSVWRSGRPFRALRRQRSPWRARASSAPHPQTALPQRRPTIRRAQLPPRTALPRHARSAPPGHPAVPPAPTEDKRSPLCVVLFEPSAHLKKTARIAPVMTATLRRATSLRQIEPRLANSVVLPAVRTFAPGRARRLLGSVSASTINAGRRNLSQRRKLKKRPTFMARDDGTPNPAIAFSKNRSSTRKGAR